MSARHLIHAKGAVTLRHSGVTVVELIVVIGIIGLLAALLVPAVQAARESARNSTCLNHLRQIGTGVAHHEVTLTHFPSGGWGFRWVGDPDRGSDTRQPGGLLFSLLPYIEATSIHSMGSARSGEEKMAALSAMLEKPIPIYVCPSRRKLSVRRYLGQYPLFNAYTPDNAFRGDYAGCGGATPVHAGFGPRDSSPASFAAYNWPTLQESDGVFYAGSRLRTADISDGLAYTYFVGEKYVRLREAVSPADRDYGDDQAALIGDDRDVRRWASELPLRDAYSVDAPDRFGSRHPNTWNVSFGDGAVKSLAHSIDPSVHRSFGSRRDNGPVNIP